MEFHGEWEKLELENKEIRKKIESEKDKYLEERMRRDLEPRDKWLGINELKQQYTPKMYERAHWNIDGKLCSKDEQAEQTAMLLKKKQWGDLLHENDEFHLAYLLNEEQENSTFATRTLNTNSKQER